MKNIHHIWNCKNSYISNKNNSMKNICHGKKSSSVWLLLYVFTFSFPANVRIKSCRFYYVVFVLYPVMMVGNDYIE